MKTAKEIYELIKEKPYKDGEQMIKDYARQMVEKRDDQFKIIFTKIIKLFEEISLELFEELPEIESE